MMYKRVIVMGKEHEKRRHVYRRKFIDKPPNLSTRVFKEDSRISRFFGCPAIKGGQNYYFPRVARALPEIGSAGNRGHATLDCYDPGRDTLWSNLPLLDSVFCGAVESRCGQWSLREDLPHTKPVGGFCIRMVLQEGRWLSSERSN